MGVTQIADFGTPRALFGCVGLVTDATGRVLLIRQSADAKATWDLPATSTFCPDSIPSALVKSMDSMLGILIWPHRFVTIFTRADIPEISFDPTIAYTATIVSGTPIIREYGYSAEVKWFTQPSVPRTQLAPIAQKVLLVVGI